MPKEKSHPFQNIISVVTKLHEECHLPAGVTVYSIHLVHTHIHNQYYTEVLYEEFQQSLLFQISCYCSA